MWYIFLYWPYILKYSFLVINNNYEFDINIHPTHIINHFIHYIWNEKPDRIFCFSTRNTTSSPQYANLNYTIELHFNYRTGIRRMRRECSSFFGLTQVVLFILKCSRTYSQHMVLNHCNNTISPKILQACTKWQI